MVKKTERRQKMLEGSEKKLYLDCIADQWEQVNGFTKNLYLEIFAQCLKPNELKNFFERVIEKKREKISEEAERKRLKKIGSDLYNKEEYAKAGEIFERIGEWISARNSWTNANEPERAEKARRNVPNSWL